MKSLAALFEDGGVALLNDLGKGATWREALRGVPPAALAGEDGLAQLASIRDHWSRSGDVDAALLAARAVLQLWVARVGPGHPDALLELALLGTLAQKAGGHDAGGRMLEKAWEAIQRAVDADDPRRGAIAAQLGRHRARSRDWAGAERVLAEALRLRRRLAPERTGQLAAQLGEARIQQGRPVDAVPLLKEAWQRQEALLGAAHPNTLARARSYGGLLLKLERNREAIAPLRQVWTHARARGDGALAAGAAFDLGLALDRVGDRQEGWRLVEEAVRWTRDVPDPPHPTLPTRLTAWARLKSSRGRQVEAEGLLLEALEAARLLHGDDAPEVAAAYTRLGHHCLRAGRVKEGIGWLDPAASLLRTAVGDADPRTRGVVDALVDVLLGQAQQLGPRDRDLAMHHLERAWAVAVPVLGFGSRKVLRLREVAADLGLSLTAPR